MSSEDIWTRVSQLHFDNEASVETRLVAPLLTALGYDADDIAPKYPVVFRKGTRGRKHEADFVVFAGAERTRDASLFVVEVKHPDEALGDARPQAESYSSVLRVPVYVLTNGAQFQLWQMQTTRESALLIDAAVTNLAVHRGQIESVLSKTALLALCEGLALKTIKPGSHDLSSYVRHLERQYYSVLRIARRLRRGDREISSSDVLLLGSSIYLSGESGLGKSDLSKALTLHHLSAVSAGHDQRPPVRIELPDAIALGKGLFTYAHDRLRAHVPTVDSDAAFRGLLHGTGIVLICDALDRVALSERAALLAECRALLHDFPKLQLVLLGRTASESGLDTLEHAALLPLKPEEQRQLAEKAGAPHALRNLGAPLDRLCENPYFLQLVLHDARATGSTPRGIVPLFRGWLGRMTSSDGASAETRLFRVEALKGLATATLNAPITFAQAAHVLATRSIPLSILDDLVRVGAVVGVDVFELQHEVLADFLRAEVLVTDTPPGTLPLTISELTFTGDSAFPILLAALIPSREAQRALWQRLIQYGAPLYLTALRYRADVSSVSLASREAQVALLEDVIDSVDDFLDGYIPQLGATVRAGLLDADGEVERISIRGQCTRDRHLTYAYAPVRADSDRVTLTDPVLEHELGSNLGFRGRDLLLSNARRDGGREIGTLDVRSVLKRLVEKFELAGGIVWSREYLWSVLPTIAHTGDVDLLGLPILELRSLLLAGGGGGLPTYNYETISIERALAALETLIAAGDQSVAHRRPELDPQTRDGILEFTRQKYDRAIVAYRDLVDRHFSRVARHLRHWPQMPIRFDIAIGPGGGFHQFVEYPRWLPVGRWEETATVVSWTDEPAQGLGDDATAQGLLRALGALGRPATTISFGGWDARIHDEWGSTAVARQVTEWLMEDVHYLFRAIGVDWPS